jgi:hypothetical protein
MRLMTIVFFLIQLASAQVTLIEKARYLQDSGLREVPNSPMHLGSFKGAVPIIGRAPNQTTTHVSFAGDWEKGH